MAKSYKSPRGGLGYPETEGLFYILCIAFFAFIILAPFAAFAWLNNRLSKFKLYQKFRFKYLILTIGVLLNILWVGFANYFLHYFYF